MNYTSAEYTMYLRDYLLDGGTLPPSITSRTELKLNNETLEDLFKLKYNLREIGYENFEMFYDMLDLKAKMYVDYYFNRIANVESLKADIFKNTSTQTSKNFVKPLGTDTDALDDVNIENASISENSFTPSGKTKIDLIADYDEKIKNYWNDLLNVFDSCFIQLR